MRSGILGLAATILISGLVLGCRKRAMPSAAEVVASTSPNIVAEEMTHSYDEVLDESGNIVSGLDIRYFAASSSHVITRVSLDGSIPGTEPLETRNRGAITKGDTAWKVTITKGNLSGYAPIFHYQFFNDPRYDNGQGYDEFGNLDSRLTRPACWSDNSSKEIGPLGPSSLLNASGGPYYTGSTYFGACTPGQDWSGYSHFQTDIWSDPEEPFWNGGWYLDNNLYVVNGCLSGDLWAGENIQPNDRATFGGFYPWFPWDFYWFKGTGVSDLNFIPGHNSSTWKFERALNKTDVTKVFSGQRRWTRLSSISEFFFGIYGAKQGFDAGKSFFVDNPRAVRSEKPAWEGNPDASAFAEHSTSRAVTIAAPGSGTWTPATGSAVTYTNLPTPPPNLGAWGGVDFSKETPLSDGDQVVLTLSPNDGDVLEFWPNPCLEKSSGDYPDQSRLVPVKINLRYRMADPAMQLLLDYSDQSIDLDTGLISTGPIVIAPGDASWHDFSYTIPSSDTWTIPQIDAIRVLLVAKDPAGAVIPEVEIDYIGLEYQPCGIYCYHPYSPYYDEWPAWRK